MPGFVDEIIESFKQTLNLPLWLYFFVVQLVEGIAIGAVFLFLFFIGFLALLGPIASLGGLENIEAIFSSPELLFPIIGIACFLLFVFLFASIFIGAFFTGMRFHLFNDFLKTKNLNLSNVFQKVKLRYFAFFKISLLAAAIISFAVVIALLPMVLSIAFGGANVFSGPGLGLFVAGIGLSAILLLVIMVALFFLSPMLNLLAPAAFFDNRGVVDSIKRSFELMKADYFGNLAFVILYALIVAVISFVLNLVVQFMQLAVMLPATVTGSSSSPAMGGMIVMVIVISMFIYIPFGIWSSVFETACFRNLYFLDLSLLKPKRKPKRKARKRS